MGTTRGRAKSRAKGTVAGGVARALIEMGEGARPISPNPSHGIVVRATLSHDFEALRAMKSDPEEVKWSGFAGPPDPEYFRHWFDRALVDPGRLMFTGLVDGVVRAYVHFHRVDAKTFGVSTGVASAFRARGYGTALRRLATDALYVAFPDVEIEAWLAEGNIASQRSWAKMAYRPTDVTIERQFFYPTRTETVRRWLQGVSDRPLAG